jgi:hypothetical protein
MFDARHNFSPYLNDESEAAEVLRIHQDTVLFIRLKVWLMQSPKKINHLNYEIVIVSKPHSKFSKLQRILRLTKSIFLLND